MSWSRIARSFLSHPAPLAVGAPMPVVSLTADDGTWFRSTDYLERLSMVLVFLADVASEAAVAQLKALEALRPKIEAEQGLLCVIHHGRPDKLRAAREQSGVGYFLLYDLIGWNSRHVGQSGRRPYVRDGFILVDPRGRVSAHVPGPVEPEALARAWAAMTLPAEDPADTNPTEVDWARAEALLTGTDPWFLIDVRTPDEFASLHHPLARNIPVDELPNRVAELGGRTKRVLTMCQTGPRSQAAIGFLVGNGFTEVASIKTGIAGWQGAKG